MTLLDDRLIGPNGLQIARFFDGSRTTAVAAKSGETEAWDEDGLDMAYAVWN